MQYYFTQNSVALIQDLEGQKAENVIKVYNALGKHPLPFQV